MKFDFHLPSRLKKFVRKTAVILPKDAGIIVAFTDLDKGKDVVEIGAGSGFLTYFLAKHARRVFAYERRADVFEILKRNLAEFENVVLKNDDGMNASEQAYLYVVDSPEAPKIIEKTTDNFRWCVCYVPNITQVRELVAKMKALDFSYISVVRVFVEEWDVGDKVLRPKHKQLYHTAFLVFGKR